MLNALKCHPFPVVAHFDRVLALSYAFPKEALKSLVPEPLEIDAYEALGFVTVALVWTRQMRPAGFPTFLGQDFFLAGFRVFVRAQDGDRRLRGLRILRSETDKARMKWSGNLLTNYNYRHVDVSDEPGHLITRTGDGSVSLDIRYDVGAEAELPLGSPFPDWRTARQFAGPMPFTFDIGKEGRVLAIEGKRAEWKPRPLKVLESKVALFDAPPFEGVEPVLANAFAVEDIAYRWERGRYLQHPGHE